MDDLIGAHERIKRILGSHTEPLESVQLVETYRRFWKPATVRVMLLAESHVYTSEDDRKIAIPHIPDLPGYPTQYAKFVYCLGYGERTLTNSASHPRRDGTPQFWKIFFSCNNPISRAEDFHPILGKTSTEQRLLNKINLLQALKAKGIWLVDTSIVALYRDGNKMPNMNAALLESWHAYTQDIVISSNPEHVICIGKGVASVVEGDLKRHFPGRYSVVAQPNAFLSSEEHMANYRTYSSICSLVTYHGRGGLASGLNSLSNKALLDAADSD